MAKQDFLDSQVWAVIGATDDPERYGSKIYRHLKANGKTVLAVNPRVLTVDGDFAYPDLTSLPQKPDAVDFVIGPDHGERYIREAASLGIRRLWFQPGTWREAFAPLVAELGVEAFQGCVMVEIKSPTV
jgi:hypothetical protein